MNDNSCDNACREIILKGGFDTDTFTNSCGDVDDDNVGMIMSLLELWLLLSTATGSCVGVGEHASSWTSTYRDSSEPSLAVPFGDDFCEAAAICCNRSISNCTVAYFS